MTKKEHPKQFGLLGKNIDYSFSRSYFSKKFTNENLIDHNYDNFDLSSISGFEQLLKNQSNLCGLNVTIPYKKEIIPLLDNLSEESKVIGAVNTVVWNNKGKKIGHNTDHIGFRKALEENVETIPKKALILGTGGASGAVRYALEQLNCEVKFVSRTAKKNQLTYAELDKELITTHTLIVNTTPLGTFPNINDVPPIPFNL
jgi:shikimate dehydrogenase